MKASLRTERALGATARIARVAAAALSLSRAEEHDFACGRVSVLFLGQMLPSRKKSSRAEPRSVSHSQNIALVACAALATEVLVQKLQCLRQKNSAEGAKGYRASFQSNRHPNEGGGQGS